MPREKEIKPIENLNPRTSECQLDVLTTNPLGPTAEEQHTSCMQQHLCGCLVHLNSNWFFLYCGFIVVLLILS